MAAKKKTAKKAKAAKRNSPEQYTCGKCGKKGHNARSHEPGGLHAR